MFFRVKQSGPRQYLQIVENFRQDGRVRQRVLTTLGRLDELRRSGNLDGLLASGARFAEHVLLLTAHRNGQVPVVQSHRIVYCLSPLRACSEQVALTSDYAAMKKAIYENKAIPSVLISPEEVVGEEERDRLEEQWNQKFRRGGSGRALVAESSMRVSVLQQSMGDLAQLAEYNATKEDICNAFHVPIAYMTTNVNMANLQAAERQHMKNAIHPRPERRDEKLNERLVPLFDPTARLFIASEDPTPVAPEILWQQQKIDMQFGARTINDVRQEQGYDPVPWGDEPWLPLNWAPTSVSRKPPTTMVQQGESDAG